MQKHSLSNNMGKYSIPLISSVGVLSVLVLSYLTYLFILLPTRVSEERVALEEELPVTGVGDYRAFVTSSNFLGDLGGLSGADSICQNHADNAALRGSWVAFLSTVSGDEYDVYAFNRVRNVEYFLVDTTTSVVDWSGGVVEGPLNHDISMDERGNIVSGSSVWTGIWTTDNIRTCLNWTSDAGTESGGFGRNDGSGPWYNAGLATCNGAHRIYCFEILRDRDGDGYLEDTDCDDGNADVHPGATEICNNTDDNCDGQIDEDLDRECGTDVGVCRKGTQICVDGGWTTCRGGVEPSEESCDNKDNDCDGSVDEALTRQCGTTVGICTKGVERCAGGKWGNCDGVQPQTEVCDGLDNDCDGQVDEGCSCDSGSTQQCGSDVGECSIGTQWCEGGVWGQCLGGKMPQAEICDGKDNDCDGTVDDNLSRSCGSDIGTCKAGVQYCNNGVWGDCSGKVDAQEEKCDGKDNDCDGTIDEGCGCVLGEERECGIEEGECFKGTQKCEKGVWSDCSGCKEPTDEICDEKDNDCDGEIDEGYVCEEEEVSEEEEEEEKKSKRPGFLQDVELGSILFGSLIISLVLVLSIVVLRKYSEIRKKRAEKKFKERPKIKRKKEITKSPLG